MVKLMVKKWMCIIMQQEVNQVREIDVIRK